MYFYLYFHFNEKKKKKNVFKVQPASQLSFNAKQSRMEFQVYARGESSIASYLAC